MNSAIVLSLGVAAAIIGLAFTLTRKGSKEREELARTLETINSIPLAEARLEANAILEDDRKFKCVRTGNHDQSRLQALGPSLREVFERFDTITCLSGEHARLSLSLFDQDSRPGLLVLGAGMETSDSEYRLGIVKGGDAIFVLYPNEPVDSQFGTYASIFHWIIAASQGH